MYLPTLSKIIAKRKYRDDFNFSFESHTGKRFQEDIKWEYGVDWEIGDIIGFYGTKTKKFDSWKDGINWLNKKI
jgi:hypothetical protein